MRAMPRIVSLAVLLLLMIALGSTFYTVVAPFLLPLFLAGMTAIICQPVYRYFLMRTKDRVYLSAGLSTTVIMLALLVPLTVGTLMASLQTYTFAVSVADDAKWKKMFQEAGDKSENLFDKLVEFGDSFLPEDKRHDPEQVRKELAARIRGTLTEVGDKSLGRAAGTTIGILAGTAGWLVAAGIAVLIYGVAVYYFFADGAALLRGAESLIPVHAKYQHELLAEFAKVVRSVVLATFLAAIAQGIATAIALWFFDFDHLFVLLVLSTIAALIPMAGTWLVWFPCAVILFLNGHWIQATLLSIYGAAFVGFLDNVIRTYVLNTDTKLHPLLAFISVLGGLQTMGLWGVFIGPIVASCLHALVKIFNHELVELSRDHFQKAMATPPRTPVPAVAVATAEPTPPSKSE